MASHTTCGSFSGYRAWTGVWTQSLINELSNKCNFPDYMPDYITAKLRRTARNVGMILADGARKLWRRRCELISLQKKGMKELLRVTERNHRAAYNLQRIREIHKKAADKKAAQLATASNTQPITNYFNKLRPTVPKTKNTPTTKSLHSTASVLPGVAHRNTRKAKKRHNNSAEAQDPELNNHTQYEHNDSSPKYPISHLHCILANDTSSLIRGSID